MANLKWQETSPKEDTAPKTNVANPWFGIALALFGLIAGFLIGNYR